MDEQNHEQGIQAAGSFAPVRVSSHSSFCRYCSLSISTRDALIPGRPLHQRKRKLRVERVRTPKEPRLNCDRLAEISSGGNTHRMLVHWARILPGRRVRQAAGIFLAALTLFSPPLLDAQAATSGLATGERVVAESTNRPADGKSPRSSTPVASHTRSKAGFLAGAGLIILSLLVLAFGLALLRTFKQR